MQRQTIQSLIQTTYCLALAAFSAWFITDFKDKVIVQIILWSQLILMGPLIVDKKDKIVNVDKNGKKEIVHRHGVTKAEKGHFDKAGVTGKRFVKEFKFENADEYQLAQEIKADIFEAGDKVDATAISKGKGFQGAIKRHNQHRGPMAHGSKFHRHAGSNGAASDPSKVFKGKNMPGHMGAKKITIQNLEIVRVDVENNLLLVKGAVPGPKKSLERLKNL